ncbi:MAG: hypothetical protein V3S43_04600 [Acidimicrobiia bacterium]
MIPPAAPIAGRHRGDVVGLAHENAAVRAETASLPLPSVEGQIVVRWE